MVRYSWDACLDTAYRVTTKNEQLATVGQKRYNHMLRYILCVTLYIVSNWLIELRFHIGDVPGANLSVWYGKLNLTQQKHTFTNQKKCTTTQNKHRKTKARFSRLLWHPAPWKWRRPILVLALHKFVTYLLTYLDTNPLTYSLRTHTGHAACLPKLIFSSYNHSGW